MEKYQIILLAIALSNVLYTAWSCHKGTLERKDPSMDWFMHLTFGFIIMILVIGACPFWFLDSLSGEDEPPCSFH